LERLHPIRDLVHADLIHDACSGFTSRRIANNFVTRFAVDAKYLSRSASHDVGGRQHSEYWIPADQLEEFNDHIHGLIEIIEEFR